MHKQRPATRSADLRVQSSMPELWRSAWCALSRRTLCVAWHTVHQRQRCVKNGGAVGAGLAVSWLPLRTSSLGFVSLPCVWHSDRVPSTCLHARSEVQPNKRPYQDEDSADSRVGLCSPVQARRMTRRM